MTDKKYLEQSHWWIQWFWVVQSGAGGPQLLFAA